MPIERIQSKADFSRNLQQARDARSLPVTGTIFPVPGVTNDSTRIQPANTSGLTGRNAARQPYAGQGNGRAYSFRLTSDLWLKSGKMLLLHAGPSEAQWTLPMRASEEEIQSGHARYATSRKFSPDGRGTYFDTPSVNFTFQTGNILPVRGDNGVTTPPGLQDFYAFMELLNQPPLTYEGKHNYTWVFYTSLMYPNMVLKGYFTPEGVSWSDSAEAPAGFQWSATFKAHESNIDPWEYDKLKDTYENFEFF